VAHYNLQSVILAQPLIFDLQRNCKSRFGRRQGLNIQRIGLLRPPQLVRGNVFTRICLSVYLSAEQLKVMDKFS